MWVFKKSRINYDNFYKKSISYNNIFGNNIYYIYIYIFLKISPRIYYYLYVKIYIFIFLEKFWRSEIHKIKINYNLENLLANIKLLDKCFIYS